MMASKMILPLTVRKEVKMAARLLPSFLNMLMSCVMSPYKNCYESGPRTEMTLLPSNFVTQPSPSKL